jgi:hypothetical protein
MSDTIGVFGQKYEDRKSKKVGTLFDRDVENKRLAFLDDNGEPFQVSFAAFKSNWRKVIVETPASEVVWPDEVEATPEVEAEPEVEAAPTPAPAQSEDDKIADFVKALTDARVASVDIIGDTCSVMADDVTICTMNKVAGGYKMFMLPDIFIFTEWGNTFKAGDVHFNIQQGRNRGVSIDCVKASLGDILQVIKTAAVEINLYGYID